MKTTPSSIMCDGTSSPTPADILHNLHSRYMESMTEEAMVVYLLEAQIYLIQDDLDGWKKRFAPTTPTAEPPTKRMKCSNVQVIINMQNHICKHCKQQTLIDDVREGSVVCTTCSIVQDTYALGMTDAHMSVDRMKNNYRYVVHRYSRIVYFRSFMDSLQGSSKPTLHKDMLRDMRRILDGVDYITPKDVRFALRKMNKSAQYRRHTNRLTILLNPAYKPLYIEPKHVAQFLHAFIRIELAWNQGFKQSLRKRKAFMSYPYIFYQLCFHFNTPQYTGPHHLLKDTGLLNKQHYMYRQLANKCKLKCDLTSLNVDRL